jgi:hypothetical protein
VSVHNHLDDIVYASPLLNEIMVCIYILYARGRRKAQSIYRTHKSTGPTDPSSCIVLENGRKVFGDIPITVTIL